ncbi:hypothetical protein JXR93_01840 [bacterium]|nr:hypothetical protein [bacterium]
MEVLLEISQLKKDYKDVKQSGFSLQFKKRALYFLKENFKIYQFITILNSEVRALDISFPYDFSKGTSPLKRKKLKLESFSGVIFASEVSDYINNIFDEKIDSNYFSDIKISFQNKEIIVQGIFNGYNRRVPFITVLGPYIENGELHLVLLEEYWLEKLPIWKEDCIDMLLSPLNFRKTAPYHYKIAIFPEILLPIYPENGYKIPDYREFQFATISFEDNSFQFSFGKNIENTEYPTSKTLLKIEYFSNGQIFDSEEYKKRDSYKIKKLLEENRLYQKTEYIPLYLDVVDYDLDSVQLIESVLKNGVDSSIILEALHIYDSLELDELFTYWAETLIKQIKERKFFQLLEILYLKIGYRMIEKNDSKSVYYFEKLWSLSKNIKWYYFDFWKELIKYKHFITAKEIGDSILEHISKDEQSEVLEGLGEICHKELKLYDESLKYFTLALKLSPNLITLKLKLIDLHITIGNNSFAALKLNELIDESDSFIKIGIHKRLSILWESEKNYERALFHLQQVILNQPNIDLFKRGFYLSQLKNDREYSLHYLKEILNYYEKYRLERDSDFYFAMKKIGFIYAEERSFGKVLAIYNEIPKEYLDVYELEILVNFFIEVGDIVSTLSYSQLLLEKESNFIKKGKISEDIALIYRKHYNNINKYYEMIGKSLIYNPNNIELFDEFEEGKHFVEDISIVENVYIKILDSINDPFEKSELCFRLYKLYIFNARKIEAIAILKKSLEYNSNNIIAKREYQKWLENGKK